MKIKVVLVVLVVLFAKNATAQTMGWVEERMFIKDGQVIQRIDGLVNGSVKNNLGTFVWFQVDKSYAQGYAGLTFSPKPWIQFAGGAGIEQDKSPFRVGGYIWLSKDKISLLFIPEYGGSGFWAKMEFNQGIGKHVGFGLISERYKGTGPRVEISISKFKLWAAPLWEKRRAAGLVGIRYKF